jgi:N-acetylglucosaminyl-diphospho-decaprenol L-rhamnosyltransferase
MTESQIAESQLRGNCAPAGRSQAETVTTVLDKVLVEKGVRPGLYVRIREPGEVARPPTTSVEIVIPVFNQLSYTRDCLESLHRSTGVTARVVVVDNGSSDGTAEYLDGDTGVDVIHNSENRGCAVAWNQGVRSGKADWVVVLNNDVLLTPGWLEGLLTSAEAEGWDIVTPAMREGVLNYELEPYAREFVKAAAGAVRADVADGVCFMVRRRVFEVIGLFDEKFRIGVFEDTDFFERARRAGFKLGTTGRSFIHHFGSVTQKSIRQGKTCGPYEQENRIYFRKKWQLNQIQRWIDRFKRRARAARWSALERRQFGHTLRECWRRDRLVYH